MSLPLAALLLAAPAFQDDRPAREDPRVDAALDRLLGEESPDRDPRPTIYYYDGPFDGPSERTPPPRDRAPRGDRRPDRGRPDAEAPGRLPGDDRVDREIREEAEERMRMADRVRELRARQELVQKEYRRLLAERDGVERERPGDRGRPADATLGLLHRVAAGEVSPEDARRRLDQMRPPEPPRPGDLERRLGDLERRADERLRDLARQTENRARDVNRRLDDLERALNHRTDDLERALEDHAREAERTAERLSAALEELEARVAEEHDDEADDGGDDD